MIPKLGLGTWQLQGEEATSAVSDALALGYRHVDTAQGYDNEAEVARGVVGSGVPREEVWLTTKIWVDGLHDDQVLAKVEESLRRADVGYFDLVLVHWPSPRPGASHGLPGLIRAQEQGLTRHLGVSNFPPGMLERACREAPILCNQVEYHPLLEQDRLLDVARRHDVAVVAYAPLARGLVAQQPVLRKIGRSLGCSASQVALRWLVQQEGVAAIPKAARHEHRVSNLEALGLELDEDAMRRVSELGRHRIRLFDPDFGPDWDA